MKLNPSQKAAVYYSGAARSILVQAGAGCGKTRTIIARAAYLVRSGVSSRRVALMTFTNRAAQEMEERLILELGSDALLFRIGTFHSFCLRTMFFFPERFRCSGYGIIPVSEQKLLLKIVRERVVKAYLGNIGRPIHDSTIFSLYSYARNIGVDPAEHCIAEFPGIDKSFVRDLFAAYHEEKQKSRYFDFEDVIFHFLSCLKEDEVLLSDVSRRYHEILVDEMQDTSPVQFQVLKLLSSSGVGLFCVGDPAQSIYAFRGADFKNIYNFALTLPNSCIFSLSENYRSTQGVLTLSNWLLGKSSLGYSPLTSALRDRGVYPLVVEFDNQCSEAFWVAQHIRSMIDSGFSFSDFLVLVRTSYSVRPLEVAFHRFGIKYSVRGGFSLADGSHVNDLIAFLRCVHSSIDKLSWLRFLQLWPGIGIKIAGKIFNAVAADPANPLRVLSRFLGLSHDAVVLFSSVLSCYPSSSGCVKSACSLLSPYLIDKYDSWESRKDHLDFLALKSEGFENLSEFLGFFAFEVSKRIPFSGCSDKDSVAISTVHRAKGTESPVCFVIGAHRYNYPYYRACGDENAEEEERRILYVALTRAERYLIVTRSCVDSVDYFVEPAEIEDDFFEDVPEGIVKKFFFKEKVESEADSETDLQGEKDGAA